MNVLETDCGVQTLVDLLQYRAAHQPDQVAYIFLKDGTTESGRLTYANLDQKARAIATSLQSIGMIEGDRAIVLYAYADGLDFIAAFFGCLYAGVVAVTMKSPSGNNQVAIAQIANRVNSAQAKVILTTKTLQHKFKPSFVQAIQPEEHQPELPWIATNTTELSEPQAWQPPTIHFDTLAFFQYTSGSTGIPKGVMVSHGNILHNEKMIAQAFEHTEQTIVMGWLPLFHDMGLVGNVLQPLYLGVPSILMSPMTLILRPYAWLQAISRYRATTSGGPNFAYDLLCRQVTPQQRNKLDLSCWEVAFSGAEPIREETLRCFVKLFAPCGFRPEAFYPCYGMAEATLLITGGQKTALPSTQWVAQAELGQNKVVILPSPSAKAEAVVGCGKPWLDGAVVIVDPETHMTCAPNQVGEIWVAGSGIAQGYWNQPEETAYTFQSYTANTGAGPFLRSGDLGFLYEGELYVTGRFKEVMIFHGLNRYPQHLELTLEKSHSAFRPNCGAAFAVTVAQQDRLIIAYEIDRAYRSSFVLDELVEIARWVLAKDHYIDLYALVLLSPGRLPKTSSGKIQRRLCRTQYLDGSLDAIAQWTSPLAQDRDLRGILRYYLNPLAHTKRYWAIAKGRIQRLSLARKK